MTSESAYQGREADVFEALTRVNDPEIRKPITDLGMVDSIAVDDGRVHVTVLLTVASCPMRDTLTSSVRDAVAALPWTSEVEVELGVMSDEQRKELRDKIAGPSKSIRFTEPGNTTRIIAVASGKGGVGKSSITANLAAALAAKGRTVGVVDADIYGHSIPRILGVTTPPTQVEGMIMPPQAHGVSVISMLPFKPGGVNQAVAFRGPMLHRALNQFLTDVYWGDLDVLLLDLPPGTGDMAMSVAQLLPHAEILVVTTPQLAAAEVAVRAGTIGALNSTPQKIVGVVENMSGFPCPHCGEPIDLFGVGGGSKVAETLSREFDTSVPLLGRIPFDPALREGGDNGEPLVLSAPDSLAAQSIVHVAEAIDSKPRGLAGMNLGLTPAARF